MKLDNFSSTPDVISQYTSVPWYSRWKTLHYITTSRLWLSVGVLAVMVVFWILTQCECSSSVIVRGPFPCPFINSCFRHAVRCSCSSVPDGQTWSIPTECVNLSSLSTSVAGAKSLQMPHRFPLFSASHFSAAFFPLLLLLVFFYSLATLVCIIIICPERALSERGLFVLQPGTRLFSGSAVFFPSPSVPSQYPGEICFCLWHLFFPLPFLVLLTTFYFPSSI